MCPLLTTGIPNLSSGGGLDITAGCTLLPLWQLHRTTHHVKHILAETDRVGMLVLQGTKSRGTQSEHVTGKADRWATLGNRGLHRQKATDRHAGKAQLGESRSVNELNSRVEQLGK